MSWGTMTVGGVAFREEIDVDDDGNLRVHGQEAHPPLLRAQVESADHNVVALRGEIVPVTFTDKQWLTGFYRVADSRSTFLRWANGAIESTTWQMALERIGSGRDVEVESRVPLIPRPDDIAGTQTVSFWHAPAVGATSYYTGPTVPSGTIDRAGEDGVVRVYTGLPTDAPRWTIRADDYLRGGVRLDVDGFRLLGVVTPASAIWSLSNSLVTVTPAAAGAITVTCFDNSIYRSPATYAFTVAGAPLGVQPELSIIRNSPEVVIVRLNYPVTAAGRVTVDLSLRRGSRFVTGSVRRHSASVIGVTETGASAGTAVTGGVRQTTADADGNRFVMGTARNATIDAANAAISLTATRLDFFLGHEVEAAGAGDVYAALHAQYLGSSGERARLVRR